MELSLSRDNLSHLSVTNDKLRYTRIINNKSISICVPLNDETNILNLIKKLSELDDDNFIFFHKATKEI